MALSATGTLLGGALLDAERGVLRAADGTATTLRPKTLELLQLLVRRAGRLVLRTEILDEVWRDLHVTDDSITQCVVELRRALGSDAGMLRTIPKRGYVLECAEMASATEPAPAIPAMAAAVGVPVVAVMPFRQEAPDSGLATFGQGVLEGVVGALAALREPVVISANTTAQLAQSETDPRTIGARLGAGYVASGSLRRAGSRLRLTVELADARSAAVLWQRPFDIDDTDGFDAQDRIAAVIANTLAPRVHTVELTLARRARPAEQSAYHLLLEARQVMFRMTHTAFHEAGLLLALAQARDPASAAVRAERAAWHGLRIGQGWAEDREAETLALEQALADALDRDGAQPRALAMLGHNHTILRRRHDDALVLFNRALAAAPNDAEALMWTAPTFAYLGDSREAIRRAERAMSLSPEDPFLFRYQHFLSIAHYAAGEFDAAAKWGISAERANPNYTSNLNVTAASLAAIGRLAEAHHLARRVREMKPGYRVSHILPRLPYRDAAIRQRFGEHLVLAGFPA
ncbi:winged helix-turn-helix domain-containing protein [Roseomonas fluvialis]|uniref:OmpR/PhoB-type domain-containing protein n=1 Tax=Roseomonas fluvialis TaxID=1750527 RepID=A0ABN6P4F4_9PROT|nr:winged helix-turn-helix domain-containing protein [Roseomonas fluvialis]BDG73539.1 hypothetical protein Rmf_34680 [Roseomonas fluvialis]